MNFNSTIGRLLPIGLLIATAGITVLAAWVAFGGG